YRRHVRDGDDGRHVLVHVRRHPGGPFREEPQADLPSYGTAAARPLARRADHRSGHGGLDQAHPRRRTSARRRGHHSGGREAATATLRSFLSYASLAVVDEAGPGARNVTV